VQVFVGTAEGESTWEAGPLVAGPDGTILYDVALSGMDARLARVFVRVSASHDGRAVSARAVQAYAYELEGQLHLVTQAAALLLVPRAPSTDDTVDVTTVGMQVSP
jgi:hypothetical protein